MGKFYDYFFKTHTSKNDVKNETQISDIDMRQPIVSFFNEEDNSENIKEEQAMQIPSFASGVDIISSSIAYLPIKLFKIDENGEKQEISDDYRVKMLNNSNSLFDSAFNMKYSQVKSLILYGTSYTYILKNGRNKIEELYFLDKKDVTSHLKKVGKMYDYEFNFQFFQESRGASSDEMMVISKDVKNSFEIEGKGVLEKGKTILKLAIEEMSSSSDSLNNRTPAYLSTDNSLSQKAKENIRTSFRSLSDKGQIPILEESLKYNSVSFKPEELELLSSRRFSSELIAQLLNIPFTFIVASATSYNNSSEESVRLLKITLSPYIKLLQEGYTKYLLTTKEIEEGMRFEFDTSQILKISAQEQATYLKGLVQSGMMTTNESRKELGLPSKEGADFLLVPTNCYILKNGDVILPSKEDEDVGQDNRLKSNTEEDNNGEE